MTEEEIYTQTGQVIEGAAQSQMFGKPCFKINGKAFICFFQNCMVFKLQGDHHRETIALPGAILFDPSGKGRPMKEWIQVPAQYRDQWPSLATAACTYVKDNA